MTVAEKIVAEAPNLPESLAREVLNFILFIEERHQRDTRASKKGPPDWHALRIDTREPSVRTNACGAIRQCGARADTGIPRQAPRGLP